ncbi:MAG: hypothetical protein ABI123_08825 [Ginsengibacter sp.]
MKQLICAIALVMGLSFAASAQNAHPKVIALLTKASWCPVCQANGPRFMKDVMPMVMKNKEVKMVMNDLSDKKTTAMSKSMLEKAGIYNFAEKNPATGMLYFFDGKTKDLVSKVSLAQPNEEIKKAYMEALSKE